MPSPEPARAGRLRGTALAWVAVCAAVACALLQWFAVRPYLPPAGHGATLSGEGAVLAGRLGRLSLTRPPAPGALAGAVTVREVPPESAAAAGGLRAGDRVLGATSIVTGRSVDLWTPPVGAVDSMRRWREAYWLGLQGPLEVRVERPSGVTMLRIERPAAWHLPWPQRLDALLVHIGPVIEVLAIVGAAVVLLLLRPRDPTALLIVCTLACAGTSAGGSLLGSESALPPPVAATLTAFSWLAMPLAFPLIGMAILYFPRKSGVLIRHPWLMAAPVAAALPMVLPALGTALFLAGADRLAPAAAWDASHPGLFYLSFAVGLLLNLAAMVEGVSRYKHNPDPVERRRVAVATATLVLATLAFTVREGVPALLTLGGIAITYPWWVTLPLHLCSAVAGAGITYAVAVHRVLSPRVVVRQSLQYALARKTLGLAAALPTTLLVVSLVKQRDMSLADIVAGRPLFYAALLGLVVAGLRYRDRARAWLDRRFFRAEYDARGVLLSLAGRIPFETDPNELTSLVVKQIDAALHPTTVGVLVGGVEPDTLVPVSVLHGTSDTLPERGGIGTLLTWSDTPLELDLDDERSAAHRLPPDEIEWLRCTGAVLFVPLSGDDHGTRRLLGALVLGPKRSEEPYSADDRALLSSIAAQVSLGLDVARLRRRQTPAARDEEFGTAWPTSLPGGAAGAQAMVAECQTCGSCHEPPLAACPTDGTPLRPGRLPRVVEAKYRVDRVLGRGGMGAVYRAHDMRLDRDVAIKVVRGELLSDPDARTRFRREAQMVARLQHPGIVAVFDYGTTPDGAAFLVMEYVRGRDLRAALRADGAMPAARVADVLRAVALPVDAAHRQGVLHRDLKPENILLPDADVPVKVLDFGVAKLVGSDPDAAVEHETLTLAGQPIGTPAYMAPEQLAGASVTPRTDVYALGAIGFELLTGAPPFGRGSLVDIAARQRAGVPPLDRTDVPESLSAAIGQALSLDPARRPATAAAFAAALG